MLWKQDVDMGFSLEDFQEAAASDSAAVEEDSDSHYPVKSEPHPEEEAFPAKVRHFSFIFRLYLRHSKFRSIRGKGLRGTCRLKRRMSGRLACDRSYSRFPGGGCGYRRAARPTPFLFLFVKITDILILLFYRINISN